MRLRWLLAAAVVVAVVVAASGATHAAAPSTVEVRDLTVDVARDVASQFGGRVDVTVRFRVVNRGTRPVRPTARIRLESQIGGGTRTAPIRLGTLGPGQHVDVVRTAGSLLPFGSARAVVTVRAGGRTTTASVSTPVIPWLLLAAAVVVVLAAVVVVRTRRSRG